MQPSTVHYKSCVIFVQDIDRSKHFYHTLLKQDIELESGPYVAFSGGLALWQGNNALETIFQHKRAMGPYGLQNCELYFEQDPLDSLAEMLQGHDIEFIHGIREHPWGQRAFRVFDPDGHIVEFAEPMPAVVRRLRQEGLSDQQIQEKTTLPSEVIQQIK